MASDGDLNDEDVIDGHVEELLRSVIADSIPRCKHDDVGHTLLLFLVRVSNTWRSIRTLRNHTPDQQGFMVDAGALLRAMLDAYFQAEYVVYEPSKSDERAKNYLDFQHVELFKRARDVTGHDNPLSNCLKASPRRPNGEKRLKEEYDRVKEQFYVEKTLKDGTIKRGPRTRNTWYEGKMSKIAQDVNKKDMYDIFFATYNGCIHSSALAVQSGPIAISPESVLTFASTIAARVTKLNVEHHNIELDDLYGQILDTFCQSHF